MDIQSIRGKKAAPACCTPQLKVVPVKLADKNENEDPTIVVRPSCIRVKRCGGCCEHIHNAITCQPLDKIMLVYEVCVCEADESCGANDFSNK